MRELLLAAPPVVHHNLGGVEGGQVAAAAAQLVRGGRGEDAAKEPAHGDHSLLANTAQARNRSYDYYQYN